MFDKLSQAAEQMATSASRREFLGRFGRGAMAAAAALGGVLALPGLSTAGRKPPYVCPGDSYTGCIGQVEGSPCLGSLGITGTCRRVRQKGNLSTACGCI